MECLVVVSRIASLVHIIITIASDTIPFLTFTLIAGTSRDTMLNMSDNQQPNLNTAIAAPRASPSLKGMRSDLEMAYAFSTDEDVGTSAGHYVFTGRDRVDEIDICEDDDSDAVNTTDELVCTSQITISLLPLC